MRRAVSGGNVFGGADTGALCICPTKGYWKIGAARHLDAGVGGYSIASSQQSGLLVLPEWFVVGCAVLVCIAVLSVYLRLSSPDRVRPVVTETRYHPAR